MFLDDIFERNRGWVRGRQPQPLPPATTMRLAVVGCYDPRLDPLLLPALGLEPGEAFLLRSAGALLQPHSTSMRSLGLAIYMFGVTEVLIVGHAACRMAMFDSAAFIEEFRRRGVPRDAFGDESLRTWAGAIASPRQGVLQSVAAVRSAPFVPKDVRVAGVVLDEATGALELVVGPDQPVEGMGAVIAPIQMRPTAATSGSPSTESDAAREGARSQSAVARSGDAEAAEAARAGAAATAPATSPSGRDRGGRLTKARERAARATAPSAPLPPPPPPRGETAPGAPPSRIAQTRGMLESVDEFLTAIQGKEHLRADLENLRDELERRQDPRQRLELLDAFGRRLGSESREVSDAFKKLRRQIGAGGADPTAQLLSIFQYLGGRQ